MCLRSVRLFPFRPSRPFSAKFDKKFDDFSLDDGRSCHSVRRGHHSGCLGCCHCSESKASEVGFATVLVKNNQRRHRKGKFECTAWTMDTSNSQTSCILRCLLKLFTLCCAIVHVVLCKCPLLIKSYVLVGLVSKKLFVFLCLCSNTFFVPCFLLLFVCVCVCCCFIFPEERPQTSIMLLASLNIYVQ